MCLFNPKPGFVAKESVRNMAAIGYAGDAMQCIFVDRGDSNDPKKAEESKKKVLNQIKQRQADAMAGKVPPLIIYPEGCETNGQNLL